VPIAQGLSTTIKPRTRFCDKQEATRLAPGGLRGGTQSELDRRAGGLSPLDFLGINLNLFHLTGVHSRAKDLLPVILQVRSMSFFDAPKRGSWVDP
jgi:hypothetical protein